jgi:hypothetical protein
LNRDYSIISGYGDLGLPIIILDGTAVLGLGFLIGVCCACVLLRRKEKLKGIIIIVYDCLKIMD